MLERLWSFDTHQTVHAFAGTGGDIFVACRSSHLHCIEALTGESRWDAGVLNSWGWLAVDSSRVYYLNQHSRLDAFDRLTGAVCWSRQLNGMNGWLHAFGTTVVVGGWRGYTDILAMDAADGATRWVRPGRNRPLHSTRIHGASSSLLIAVGGQPGIFDFVDLLTGDSKANISVPGSWGGTFSERPIGTSGDEALVVERDDASFTMVTGSTPAVTVVELAETIASRNLQLVDGVIPYMTPGGELVAWSLAASRLLRLGAVHHNRLDMLPFAVLGDDLFVYGTSFGMLGLTSTTVGNRHARRISKRVSTMIATTKDAVIFGTAGGTVVAYTGLANMALHPPPGTLDRLGLEAPRG